MSQETQFSQFIAMKNEGSYKVKRQYQSKEKTSQLSQIYTDAKKYSKSINVKLIVHQTDRIADSSIIVSNPELRLPDIRPKFTTLQTDVSSPLGGLNYFRLNIIEKQPPILTKLEKITYRQQLLKMLPQRKTQRSAIDASDTLLNSYVQRIKQVSQIKPEKEYTLEHHINVINTAIVQDKQLKFTSKHYFIHKHFITQLLTSDEQSFELQKLDQIHKCLNITKEQFTRFKIHIISHILQMGMEKEKILKICERFEFYRPYIVSEEIHLKVLGGLNGLQVISSNLYDRLYKDPILNSHFKNADQSTLSKKFAKAFYHVLSMNENLNSLNQLKHRHQNLDINYQQFAQFKLQLSRTLQQQGVKFKFIREALSRMDVFKQSIINKQSVSDLVQQNNLIEKFTKACLNEPILFDISHSMGKQKFSNHCEFVMLYFSGMNIKAFTNEDLMAIHCHKKIVNERTFECFKSRACGEVSRCTFDRILLEDYRENWDQAKPFVLGKNYSGVIHKLGGQKFISHLSQLVEYEFIIREISHHFNSDEFSVNENIRCKLNLLLYANRFYKKTDLEVIHSQLKINNELYDSFKNAIMTALNTYEELKWIEHVIEDYRNIIVTQ